MRQPDFTRRVVVTGLGVVSPVGNDKDTAWSNLINGVSGIGEITKFDVTPYRHRWAGEVHDFDPAAWMDPKAVRRSESAMWYGVAAAKQAITDAGLEQLKNLTNLRELNLAFTKTTEEGRAKLKEALPKVNIAI